MSIKQRITDWRREQRIRDISRAVADAYSRGHRSVARAFETERTAEIKARSSAQRQRVARRMERAE